MLARSDLCHGRRTIRLVGDVDFQLAVPRGCLHRDDPANRSSVNPWSAHLLRMSLKDNPYLPPASQAHPAEPLSSSEGPSPSVCGRSNEPSERLTLARTTENRANQGEQRGGRKTVVVAVERVTGRIADNENGSVRWSRPRAFLVEGKQGTAALHQDLLHTC